MGIGGTVIGCGIRVNREGAEQVGEVLKRQGVEELYEAYLRLGLTGDDFSARFVRVEELKRLLAAGLIDGSLRWIDPQEVDKGHGIH